MLLSDHRSTTAKWENKHVTRIHDERDKFRYLVLYDLARVREFGVFRLNTLFVFWSDRDVGPDWPCCSALQPLALLTLDTTTLSASFGIKPAPCDEKLSAK